MADYTELQLDQGTTFNYTLVLNDDTTNANINISGYSISSQMRKSYYSVNATANLTCTVFDAANGVFNVSLTAANTANIKSGRYMFDIVYDTGEEVVRALEGTIRVNPRVTR
jgi:hypothetical protein